MSQPLFHNQSVSTSSDFLILTSALNTYLLPPLDEFTAIAGSYQLPVSKIDYHGQEQFWNMKQT